MLAVVLHNGIGMALWPAMARLMKVSYAKETSIAIEVAMQNSGLALALATAKLRRQSAGYTSGNFQHMA